MKHLSELISKRLVEVGSYFQLEADLSPSEEVCSQLAEYLGLLQKWTQRVDLVAPACDEEQVERHIVDSVAAYWMILKDQGLSTLESCLDVGSGAGLPGAVFAICDRRSQLYLCEPREKRVVFLREIVRTLCLQNVTIIPTRSEQISMMDLNSPARLVVARALGSDKALIGVSKAVLSADGSLVQLVGPSYREQTNQGIPPERIVAYSVSKHGPSRSLAVWPAASLR